MSLESKTTVTSTHQLEQSIIAKDVAECLENKLPAGEKLAVRVIHTSDHLVDSLTPRRTRSHFSTSSALSRRVLILVSRSDCFVAGLEAHEFTSISAELTCVPGNTDLIHNQNGNVATVSVDACIQKIDTTGELSMRMPLARTLVAGYMRSLRRYRCLSGISSIGVYLFARAQPEYLFAKSQQNRGKRTLADMALIKWWQGTMQYALLRAMSVGRREDGQGVGSGCKAAALAYCVIPGAAANEAASWFLGSCNSANNTPLVDDTIAQQSSQSKDNGECPPVRWSWGLPYPDSARAHNCVLQFPDDPMTRLLSEPHSNSWSVAMLLEMLSVSEECGSGHRTAYISASLPVACLQSLPVELSARRFATADQGSLSFDNYDDILVALFDREMDFSDTKASISSTARLDAYLDSNHSIQPFVVNTNGPALSQTARTDAAGNTSSSGNADTTKINDLSMMMRKKRKVI
ncbi:hypothetical protein EV175_004263 [Coemansia sp. RSA 1933]|nr:hypothetical protein EV175_004263 [Coemansia sp. RSA 1933]